MAAYVDAEGKSQDGEDGEPNVFLNSPERCGGGPPTPGGLLYHPARTPRTRTGMRSGRHGNAVNSGNITVHFVCCLLGPAAGTDWTGATFSSPAPPYFSSLWPQIIRGVWIILDLQVEGAWFPVRRELRPPG